MTRSTSTAPQALDRSRLHGRHSYTAQERQARGSYPIPARVVACHRQRRHSICPKGPSTRTHRTVGLGVGHNMKSFGTVSLLTSGSPSRIPFVLSAGWLSFHILGSVTVCGCMCLVPLCLVRINHVTFREPSLSRYLGGELVKA